MKIRLCARIIKRNNPAVHSFASGGAEDEVSGPHVDGGRLQRSQLVPGT